MRGHQPIIDMRIDGMVPGTTIFIEDFPVPTDWDYWGDCPTVCVHGDQIQLLDLRFVVGLTVAISSDSEDRAKELFSACKEAGARVVVGLCNERDSDGNRWGRYWKKQAAKLSEKQELEAA